LYFSQSQVAESI
jgi:hypothetical protein